MSHGVTSPQKAVRHHNTGQQSEKYSDTGFLFKLSDRALVVCHIVLSNNQGGGTGFLIGKDLIMTNNHVLDSLETARGAKALFFHTTNSKALEVDLDPDTFFYTSPTPDLMGFKPLTKAHLDFTLVSIKSHPKIAEVSHLAFSILGTPLPEKESHANIIHHPHQETTYQKISHRENLIKEVSLFTIHYTTATLPGSSGAPVIDDEGNLIALHRATCTHLLKALLEKEMLKALLYELFPGIEFTSQTLTLMNAQSGQEKMFTGLCATIDGSLLYIFSEGELKGQYFHQGKLASLFRLIETQHPSPKKWALQFLNSRLEEPLADYHCECNTAVSIKAIHDHLKNVGMLAQIQARYQECQKNLCSMLKESYLQQYAFLPLILTNEAFPIESFFTQLSIASYASQEKKEEEARKRDPNLIEKDSLRELYARLYETDRPIDLNTLFEERENKPVKRVLILGRAGIGKSTLCQKIAYDWASGTLFEKKFDLIYHLRLRDLNSLIRKYPLKSLHPDKWLSKIIAKACYGGAHKEKINREIQSNPDKILLVFDGWDEASLEVVQAIETYFLQTKIKHCLLTSRPGVTGKIHNNFDLVVENMGFNETQIETYATKFFTHTQREGLNAFLKALRSRSNLFTIAHIPIQLQILCALWQKGEQEFPQTLTPLFSKITHHLFEWEQKKIGQQKELTPLKKLFLYQALGEVALQGLESKQLIFPKILVENALTLKALEDRRYRNIHRKKLIGTGLIKECGINGEMYFLHLTYQEYSIAKYISSLRWSCRKEADEKQLSFVQTYRYRPQFHLVIRMLAGCIWEDSNKDIKTLETFFEWLYSGHTDLVGSYQTELALSCLDECRNHELEKRIWEKYNISDFVESILKRPTTWDCLKRLMLISEKAFLQVIKHFENGKDVKEQTLWLLKNVERCLKEEGIPQILKWIDTALCDVPAKNELLPTEKMLTVFNWIETALRGKDFRIRQSAFKAFERLVARVKEENALHVIDWAKTLLSHQDPQVRKTALRILGKFAHYVGEEHSTQIVQWIAAALRDQDYKVKNAACKMLDAVITQKKTETTLDLILTVLHNKFSYLLDCSFDVLKVVEAQANRKNIIPLLNRCETILNDQHASTRKMGFKALERLAPYINKEYVNRILDWIEKACTDTDPTVICAGLKALKKFVSHTEEKNVAPILNWVQATKKIGNWELSQAIYAVLKELIAHAKGIDFTSIFRWFQRGLSSTKEHIFFSTQVVLGTFLKHVKPENVAVVLDWIEALLSHKNLDVRQRAVWSLRDLASHEKEKNFGRVFSFLQIAFNDTNDIITRAALDTLGDFAPHIKEEYVIQTLNWIEIGLKNKNYSEIHKAAINALTSFVQHVKEENVIALLKWITGLPTHIDCYVYKTIVVVTLKTISVPTKKETLSPILHLFQDALTDQNLHALNEVIRALGKFAARAKGWDFPETLEGFCDQSIAPQIISTVQKSLNSQELDTLWAENIFEIFLNDQKERDRHFITEENISQTLTRLQTLLRDVMRERVDHWIYDTLEKIITCAEAREIPRISSWLQNILSDSDYDPGAHSIALKALVKIAEHADEDTGIPIVNCLQTAYTKKSDPDIFNAFNHLNNKHLLVFFISQPSSQTLFDHFVNASVPLYLMENNGGCFIHTSDNCYKAFDPKQLTLLTQTWTKSTKFENTKETCILM